MDKKKLPRVVFLTGAGLSADSGVPTFRGEEGFYRGVRVEDFLSAHSTRRNPESVHRFIDDMRMRMALAMPNAAHQMIARLGSNYPDQVIHFTQNIDTLIEAAGYSQSIHLHGIITRMRSIGNSKVTEDIGFSRYWDGDASTAPARGFRCRCPKTGSLFRPDVVLFDEIGPYYSKLHKAVKDLRSQDTFVVIGTQADIYPIRMAIYFAERSSAVSILNNLHSNQNIDENLFDHVFLEKAVDAASKIEEIVRERIGR